MIVRKVYKFYRSLEVFWDVNTYFARQLVDLTNFQIFRINGHLILL
jgi:hypothetical protein